jgi:triosephosphate isomerase (TIM)
MTRQRLVIGNWKMNPPTLTAAIDLARRVARGPAPKGVQVGVAPPSIFLPEVADALRETPIAVYAQDISAEEGGARTGQVSAAMVKAFAVATLVGHSEVRRELGDDDERVARKLARALNDGLAAVLCIGESGAEFDAGETGDVLVRQLSEALRGLRTAGEISRLPERLVIAYEPVWAIGTGRPATAAHASTAALAIRQLLSDAVGPDGDAISILYGGSVTAAGAPEFATSDGIDGALVGGASLDAVEFAGIVRAFG